MGRERRRTVSPANMTGILPQNIVDRMAPADRAAIGQKTSTEAREAAIVKSERELQKQIAGYLRLLNVPFYQSRMDRKTTMQKGTPDFLVCRKGRFVAWEVKTPWCAVLRPEQAIERAKILSEHGDWRLITSLAEAQAHLREIDGVQVREGA
jgi:hypothetical protein